MGTASHATARCPSRTTFEGVRSAWRMASSLASQATRAQLLSHGISGAQAAHYDRHAYTDEKRAALVTWEARLAAIVQAERQPANVRHLRAA